MNDDVFKGKWKQFRGRVKEWWGDLTDDELDRVQGQREQFVGLLQERYGYTRERAEDELGRRMREFDGEPMPSTR
ncbi:MAG: CsbD family protein [Anaerolineales bacterium]